MKKITTLLMSCLFMAAVSAQESTIKSSKPESIIPYVNVLAGGCVDNPFQFAAGVLKPVQPHISIAADVSAWSTGYECFCDNIHTVGHFKEITPSVKIIYNTGKQTGRGLITGLGLGYMFAQDRGTEQPFTENPVTLVKTFEDKVRPGNWDFNSIAPSFTLGVGFRLWQFPVSWTMQNYFAKTKSDGWQPSAGGMGFTFGLRKLKQ